MKIFPAIDLRGGKVVRLLKGDYDRMTVFGDDPLAVAKEFAEAGAEFLHVVDLDGAKDGDNPNFDIVKMLAQKSGLKVEILGTIAVENPIFTADMIAKYGDQIAVSVDIAGRNVAVRGWREISQITVDAIFDRLTADGVNCVICTDISKDGAMEKYSVNIVASGGVSSMEEVKALTGMGVYGAIIGKALYTGDIDLASAIREGEGI